jgi:hypothetical protein
MGQPLDIVPAVVPPEAEEVSRGVWRWEVPGAIVVLPFLSADPLKDDTDWLEKARGALPRTDFEREYLVDFTTFSGKPVYPEFRDHIHVARQPLPYAPNRTIIRGWDIPGPLACVWLQLYPIDGASPAPVGVVKPGSQFRLHILAELYAELPVSEFARQVKSLSTTMFPQATSFLDWSDPQAWAASGANDKRTCAQIIREETGILLNPGPVDLVSRTEPVRQWLGRLVPTANPSEPPGALLLDPSCSMLRAAFKGGYRYEEIQASGRFKEVPEKNEYSHVMNALEYAVARLSESEAFMATKEPRKRTSERQYVLGAL